MKLDVYAFQEVWDEHFSWTIRRTDDSLVAFYSTGHFLPPADLTVPLQLTSSKQACSPQETCLGTSGPMDITVQLGDDVVTVPHANIGTLGADDALAVVVEHASWGEGVQCGIHGTYRIHELLVVATDTVSTPGRSDALGRRNVKRLR